MIIFIITMLIVGIIAGFVARAVLPGDDSMSVPATILLGVVGSLVGGFLGYLIFGRDAADGALQTSGLVGSIIGAVLVLLLLRLVRTRSDEI
jgi:uncharacterized membrane protein YeaQ/YmgE (transglycosylase-associated protein family)